MKRAIFSVCPDQRQQSILDQVYPTWAKFAERHGLDIIVVKRSITGAHPYWDRWMCFDHKEADGYDQLLLLDNDIWISDGAKNPFEYWTGNRVGAALESRQAGWDADFIKNYYPGFLVELGPGELDFDVFNFGVTLVDRKLKPWFLEHFQFWSTEMKSRFERSDNPAHQSFFVKEADGPFMSWHLQHHDHIEEIPDRFNRLIPHWYAQNVKFPEKLYLVEAKLAQLTRGKIPTPLWKLISAHPRGIVNRCADSCDFLHMAGSKCPLWLLNPPA